MLYAPAVVLVIGLSAVWILRDAWTRSVLQAASFLNVLYVLVASYLVTAEGPML